MSRGSFAPIDADLHSPYYLLCMVFHDQADDIISEVRELESTFGQMGIQPEHTVHAGPLIRREDEYANMQREQRIRIFRRMMIFIQKAKFRYRCFKLFKPYNCSHSVILLLHRCGHERFPIPHSPLMGERRCLAAYADRKKILMCL